MKKFIKNIFVIFILSTVFFLLGCEDDFVYELDNNQTGYILKGYRGSAKSIIIPDSYKGLPVIGIGAAAFYGKKNITGDLIIPESVTIIGFEAFSNTGFTKVVLPKNLKIIGPYAFYECANLTSINFPDGIEKIGENAFCDCKKLTGILNIPKNITEIYSWTFCRTGFTKVVLPKNLKIIGDVAFLKCENLESINLHDGITGIGEGAFCDCKKLTGRLNIPKSLTKIKKSAFSGTGYTSVYIPKNIKIIEYSAFSQSHLTGHIIIPDTVEQIESYAFSIIDAKKITISKNIKKIDGGTFEYCRNLQEVVIPEGIIEIGGSAFSSSLLKSVIIPSTVTSIGAYAFSDCKNLKNIICEAQNPPIIEKKTFEDSPIKSIIVPNDAIDEYKNAPVWEEFADIITSQ